MNTPQPLPTPAPAKPAEKAPQSLGSTYSNAKAAAEVTEERIKASDSMWGPM